MLDVGVVTGMDTEGRHLFEEVNKKDREHKPEKSERNALILV